MATELPWTIVTTDLRVQVETLLGDKHPATVQRRELVRRSLAGIARDGWSTFIYLQPLSSAHWRLVLSSVYRLRHPREWEDRVPAGADVIPVLVRCAEFAARAMPTFEREVASRLHAAP